MRVEILEYWLILHTGSMADIAFLLIFVCKLADDDVNSSQNLPISLEIVTFRQETLQFYLPAVPGLIALNFLCQITQRLLNQILRYLIYE